MITQVAHLILLGMFDKIVDYHWWQEQGWKGVSFAVLVGVVVFGVVKQHIGFATIGPNEAGIREFLGMKLWKLGPGPHFYITGFSSVRKASLAIKQFDARGNVMLDDATWTFYVAIKARVPDNKHTLISRIYTAEDNDKTNMVNGENEKQMTSTLTKHVREILEVGNDLAQLEQHLAGRVERVVAIYGYQIVEVIGIQLTPRPLTEAARIIARLNQVSDAGVMTDNVIELPTTISEGS